MPRTGARARRGAAPHRSPRKRICGPRGNSHEPSQPLTPPTATAARRCHGGSPGSRALQTHVKRHAERDSEERAGAMAWRCMAGALARAPFWRPMPPPLLTTATGCRTARREDVPSQARLVPCMRRLLQASLLHMQRGAWRSTAPPQARTRGQDRNRGRPSPAPAKHAGRTSPLPAPPPHPWLVRNLPCVSSALQVCPLTGAGERQR
jgi:hypothetical protein